MFIVHPEYRCGDGCDSPLYHIPLVFGDYDDGGSIQIVHACEHLVGLWPGGIPYDEAIMVRSGSSPCHPLAVDVPASGGASQKGTTP